MSSTEKSWFQILQEYIETQVSDEEFNDNKYKAVTKESYEFLLESEAAVDITKPSKHTTGLWDQIKSMALPVVGGLLLSALSHFFPMVGVILEVILVSIGIFELIGAVCKVDKIKQKMGNVCSIQHDIHHFLEAKSGGQ